MLESIRTLLTSKRALVVLLTSAINVLLLFGVTGIPEDAAETLAAFITALGAVLVAGYSATDAAKAVQLPPGEGHKDA